MAEDEDNSIGINRNARENKTGRKRTQSAQAKEGCTCFGIFQNNETGTGFAKRIERENAKRILRSCNGTGISRNHRSGKHFNGNEKSPGSYCAIQKCNGSAYSKHPGEL